MAGREASPQYDRHAMDLKTIRNEDMTEKNERTVEDCLRFDIAALSVMYNLIEQTVTEARPRFTGTLAELVANDGTRRSGNVSTSTSLVRAAFSR